MNYDGSNKFSLYNPYLAPAYMTLGLPKTFVIHREDVLADLNLQDEIPKMGRMLADAISPKENSLPYTCVMSFARASAVTQGLSAIKRS